MLLIRMGVDFREEWVVNEVKFDNFVGFWIFYREGVIDIFKVRVSKKRYNFVNKVNECKLYVSF